MSSFYKWETNTRRSHTTSWKACQNPSPLLLIPNTGSVPVYQEGNKTSQPPAKRPVLTPTLQHSIYVEEHPTLKLGNRATSPPGLRGLYFLPSIMQAWEIRYYLQPEYINHLKAEIQFGEWQGVHSSILAKHILDRCLPRSQNRKHSRPHQAGHCWEQLTVEGF